MYSSNGHANEDFVWQSPVVAKSTAARQGEGVRSAPRACILSVPPRRYVRPNR